VVLSQRWQSDLPVLNVSTNHLPQSEVREADDVEYKELLTGQDRKISSGGTFLGTSHPIYARADKLMSSGFGSRSNGSRFSGQPDGSD
jgi:hypothetical protein